MTLPILLLCLLFSSCKPGEDDAREQRIIMEIVIDTVLSYAPGSIVKPSFLDISEIPLDKNAINRLLKKRPEFSIVNADSLLKNDPGWKKYGYLENELLIFKSMKRNGDSLYIIELERIRAVDNSEGILINIKKAGNQFIIVQKGSTWMS